MGQSRDLGFYRKFLGLTIAIVCLLILAGGVVRSTGSGMGCPDWPKCFGSWIPPTHISQLPEDYKEVYSKGRHKKNLRAASYLDVLGFSEVAHRLRTDKSILVEETFNPQKTWIEYINRLLGVVTGFLIFLNIILAFPFRKEHPGFLVLALINFILVGFQGWVGSIVVSTNLLSGMITFHMVLALIILAVLIYNYVVTFPSRKMEVSFSEANKAYWWMTIALFLFVVQVVFGTQVREGIDQVAKLLGESQRSDWISQLGLSFYIHRSYSIVILLVHLYAAWLIIRQGGELKMRRTVYLLLSLIVVEILSGTIMAYFSIPAVLQPLHLLVATLIFGLDFFLLLELNQYRKPVHQPQVEVGHI